MKLTEEYWNNCYQNNDTGWDLGKISTPIEAYFSQLNNKELSRRIKTAISHGE